MFLQAVLESLETTEQLPRWGHIRHLIAGNEKVAIFYIYKLLNIAIAGKMAIKIRHISNQEHIKKGIKNRDQL